ncbi:unnamed protein product, partial [Nesidiocoris tenuis]
MLRKIVVEQINILPIVSNCAICPIVPLATSVKGRNLKCMKVRCASTGRQLWQ